MEAREQMRLQPIEKPKGFMMRMAYWGMKRQMGKVMTPVKVMGPRIPRSMGMMNSIAQFELKKIRLEPELHILIGVHTAQTNGCGWCTDFGRSMVIRDNLSMKKFDALSEYKTSPLFSDRERAALSYAEEATRNKRVSDATFDELQKHFKDWEIAEINWINAIENYYNLINIPLEIESDGFCASVKWTKNIKTPNDLH